MNCWPCDSDVIWGGDDDFEDYCLEGDGIVSNFRCSKCPATYLCYYKGENSDKRNRRKISTDNSGI